MLLTSELYALGDHGRARAAQYSDIAMDARLDEHRRMLAGLLSQFWEERAHWFDERAAEAERAELELASAEERPELERPASLAAIGTTCPPAERGKRLVATKGV